MCRCCALTTQMGNFCDRFFYTIIVTAIIFLHLLFMCVEEPVRDDFPYYVFRDIALMGVWLCYALSHLSRGSHEESYPSLEDGYD